MAHCPFLAPLLSLMTFLHWCYLIPRSLVATGKADSYQWAAALSWAGLYIKATVGLVMDLHEKRPGVHSTFIDSYCSEVSKGETIYLNPAADSAANSELGQEPKEHQATPDISGLVNHPAKNSGVFSSREVVGKYSPKNIL